MPRIFCRDLIGIGSRRWLCVLAAGVALLAAASAASAQMSISVLSVGDLAANGSAGSGTLVTTPGVWQATYWTPSGGHTLLGDLPGGLVQSSGAAISGDGSTVVGMSRSDTGDQAFRWTQSTGMVGLGYFPSEKLRSEAAAVSTNGSVIVGNSNITLTAREAFRWTEANGLVSLGHLPSSAALLSNAADVSGDGTIVVGTSSCDWGVGTQAFRWTQETGMVGIGALPGQAEASYGYAISADGSTIVGVAVHDNPGKPGTFEAFRWTQAEGMVGLGDLPGGYFWSLAWDVSADGSVIVGRSNPDNDLNTILAFIWTEDTGIKYLRDVLAAGGADLTGWGALREAYSISPDGHWIAGSGVYNGVPAGFVAHLTPEPTTLALLALGGLALLRRRSRKINAT